MTANRELELSVDRSLRLALVCIAGGPVQTPERAENCPWSSHFVRRDSWPWFTVDASAFASTERSFE